MTFIIPPWINVPECTTDNIRDIVNCDSALWLATIGQLEIMYKGLREQGWKPEQARSVLPNSLKTEIVVTANLREWRLILKQRTASAAHPQMRELMRPLLDELKTLIPVIFDDICYNVDEKSSK